MTISGTLSRCSINICFLRSDRILLHQAAVRLGIFTGVLSLVLAATPGGGGKVLEAERGQVTQLLMIKVSLQANPSFQHQCLSTAPSYLALLWSFVWFPPLHRLVSKPVSEILPRAPGLSVKPGGLLTPPNCSPNQHCPPSSPWPPLDLIKVSSTRMRRFQGFILVISRPQYIK